MYVGLDLLGDRDSYSAWRFTWATETVYLLALHAPGLYLGGDIAFETAGFLN